MPLETFRQVKTVIQLFSLAIIFYFAYRSYFRQESNRRNHRLIGLGIVVFFGIEFVGEALVPGFQVVATPRWLRIAMLCFGVYFSLSKEGRFFK